MDLIELGGRRVVLLGLGADVTAAVPAILDAEPSDVRLVLDDEAAAQPGAGSAEAALERVSLVAGAATGEVFVRAPGFPRYSPPLVGALGRGARMTTPLDLWMGTHGAARTVIGITGTKGKSSVTRMVGLLAEDLGLRIGVAGNIGQAVFDDGWDHEAPTIALEISSYQAADLHHVPDIAAIPFLAQDHVSWHGGVERYVADKLRVVRNESGSAPVVLVAEDAGRAVEELKAFGVDPVVVAAPTADAEIPIQRVRNAALAAAVVARLGAGEPTEAQVLAAAETSMPGRLDRCAGPDGLLCIDDTLASNPTATAASLAWLRGLGRPTVVLLGGQDRGVDVSPLVDEAARWPARALSAVALPDTGEDLARAASISTIAAVGTVTAAVDAALAAVDPRGAVLFSPAAATPTRIGNWETRSAQFRAALADAETGR